MCKNLSITGEIYTVGIYVFVKHLYAQHRQIVTPDMKPSYRCYYYYYYWNAMIPVKSVDVMGSKAGMR